MESAGAKHILRGFLWFAGGCTFTALTYAAAASRGGGVYIITTGAIVIGFVQFLYGLVILIGERLSNPSKSPTISYPLRPTPPPNPNLSPTKPGYMPDNDRRWNALVIYDEEIRVAADKLRPFGRAWVDKLGQAFFDLNEDRGYLPQIVRRLLEDAKHNETDLWKNRLQKTADGDSCTEESLSILKDAIAQGCSLEVQEDGTFVLAKGTSKLYLRSNGEIRRNGGIMLRSLDDREHG